MQATYLIVWPQSIRSVTTAQLSQDWELEQLSLDCKIIHVISPLNLHRTILDLNNLNHRGSCVNFCVN